MVTGSGVLFFGAKWIGEFGGRASGFQSLAKGVRFCDAFQELCNLKGNVTAKTLAMTGKVLRCPERLPPTDSIRSLSSAGGEGFPRSTVVGDSHGSTRCDRL